MTTRKASKAGDVSIKMFSKMLKKYGLTIPDLELIAQTRHQAVNQAIEPETILDIAGRLVQGDRNKTYKHPNENFRNIANFWNGYFLAIAGRPGTVQSDAINGIDVTHISEYDVAMLNILMKVARAATNNEHIDNLVDIAGYARCAERVLKEPLNQ